MASSIFFNGRLHSTPGVMTRLDDTAMAPTGLTVGNVLAVLGRAQGGKPNTPLRFGSPAEARQVLIGGDLLTAVEKAFAPSTETNAPAEVVAIRVGAATQASLALADADDTNVITLTSDQYGLDANRTKVKIEAGTNRGKRITTQLGHDYYTADDIARDAFTVEYTGTALTASISTTNGQVTLAAGGADVATIPLADYPTIGALVDRINAVPDFEAAAAAGSADHPSLNALDTVTNQDCKTAPFTVTANLQAIVDWFNGLGEGFVTATREAGAGAVPANIDWTYLSGATDPAVTNEDWNAAFTVLQEADVQWVAPLSGAAAVHAMASAHCTFCSDVLKRERRALVGPNAGTPLSQVLDQPKALNSDRVALVWPGIYDYDRSGALVLLPPYMAAAIVAAMFAGSDPGMPMTNKSLSVRGLEVRPRNPVDTDQLIQAGVLCLEEYDSTYRVVRSVSTWLNDNKYNRVEVSCGAAADFVARNVREAVRPLVGQPANPRTLSRTVATVESTLRELARPQPTGPGVLVGDEQSPPYRNITATAEGDVVRVSFECSPVIPANFFPITIALVPYSGTASA